jgi:hypothetical protein
MAHTKQLSSSSSSSLFLSFLNTEFCTVRIANGYRLDDWGSGSSIHGRGWELSPAPLHPDQFWAPPSLLSIGYWGLFPWM